MYVGIQFTDIVNLHTFFVTTIKPQGCSANVQATSL